jgi:hypothetical protein
MKDERTTEYIERMKKIGLGAEARLRMREELEAFADFHGVRIAEEVRSIDEVQRTSVFSLFISSHSRIMKATLLIALMVGMGGSSLAAQNALPGDLLYPVKVHVNENVRGAFALDANTKATLQLALLEERLQEAKELSASGKLHGEVEADVLATIATQVDKTVRAANEAEAETGAEVRLAVSQELTSFSNWIAAVPASAHARTQTDTSASIAAKSGATDDADVMAMSAIGIELAGEISVADIVAQAQTRLEALQKTIRGAVALSAEVRAEFEAQLKAASELVTKAQADLRANAEAQAEANAQKAHEILGEVESSLSLMGEVQIDFNTGHIIGIDLSGNSSNGGGTSGSVDGNAGVDIDVPSYDDVMIDPAFDAGASGSAEGSFGF